MAAISQTTFFIAFCSVNMLVPKDPIDSMAAGVQIMAWSQRGDKPLSELMMAYFTDAYMHHTASMNLLIIPWEMQL